jgi:hypothetical protein
MNEEEDANEEDHCTRQRRDHLMHSFSGGADTISAAADTARGPGARRVEAGLSELPQATAVVLADYTGHTWADIAADDDTRRKAATLPAMLRDALALLLSELASLRSPWSNFSLGCLSCGSW